MVADDLNEDNHMKMNFWTNTYIKCHEIQSINNNVTQSDLYSVSEVHIFLPIT